LIPDIEKFLPVAIFKMAVTILHKFNIVRFQWTLSWRGVFNSTLCDKVCQLLAKSRWFSTGTPVSSTNKTDRHDITEILLKVAFNTINQPSIYDIMHAMMLL
jgi:hypothetical protein